MSLVIHRLLEAALRAPTALRWLAVVAWAGMIFLASSQQGLAVSDDPGVDRPLRQVAHMVVFGGLTVLLIWALTGSRLPSVRLAVACGLLALLYGVTDEWHQTLVPTRSGRAEDLVWDGVGALVAIGLVLVVSAAAERARSRRL